MSSLDKKYGLNRRSLYNEALAPDFIKLDPRGLSQLMAQAVVISRHLPFYHTPDTKITKPESGIYFQEKIWIDLFETQATTMRLPKFKETETVKQQFAQLIKQSNKSAWQQIQSFKKTNPDKYKKLLTSLKNIYTKQLREQSNPYNYDDVYEKIKLLAAAHYNEEYFNEYILTDNFEVSGWEKMLLNDISFILAHLENYDYQHENNLIIYKIDKCEDEEITSLKNELLYRSLNHIINILRTYNCLNNIDKKDFIELEAKSELESSVIEKIAEVIGGLDKNLSQNEKQSKTSLQEAKNQLNEARLIYNETIDILKIITKIPSRHLADTLEKKKDHDPSIGLLIAFFKTFKLIQDELGRVSYKFIEYYYKKLLEIKPLPAVADKTYISVKPASHIRKTEIIKGTEIEIFSKQHNQTYTYETLKDAQINRAKLKYLRTLYVNREERSSENRIAHVFQNEFDKENIAEGSTLRLFGRSLREDIIFNTSEIPKSCNIGFVVGSRSLLLRSGRRTVLLYLTLNEEEKIYYDGGNDNNTLPIDIQLSTNGDQWINKQNMTTENPLILDATGKWIKAVLIRVHLDENDAPVTGNKALTGFTHLPAIKVTLKDYDKSNSFANAWLFFECFKNIKRIQLGVKAENAEVFGDESNSYHLVNGEDYFPFTMIPTIGKTFRVYNKEVHCKNLNDIDFKLTWATLPADFNDYYAPYLDELSPALEEIKYENYQVKVFSSLGNADENSESKDLFPQQEESEEEMILNTKHTIHLQKEDLTSLNGENYHQQSLVNRDSYFGFELARNNAKLPLYPFLHDMHNRVLEVALFKRSKNEDDQQNQVSVKEPFTPTLSGINIDYKTYKDEYDPDTYLKQDFEVFQILPFESKALKTTNELLPSDNFGETGYLTLGFSNIQPQASITVFFELSNINIAIEKDYTHPQLHYQYWTLEGWKSTEPATCIKNDETQEFTRSGNITFTIPPDAVPKMENDEVIYAIQISTKGNAMLFSSLVRYTEQSVLIQRKIEGEKHRYTPVSPHETVVSMKKSTSNIEQLNMLVETYGGKSTESGEEYLYRVSDQFHSKSRLVTRKDFERFILNNFSEVHAVRCLLPGTYIDIFDNNTEDEPRLSKEVLIVVMPEISDYYNKTAPRFNYKYLQNIENKIKAFAVEGIALRVINPVYLHLEVILQKAEGVNTEKELIAEKLHALWNENKQKKIGQLPAASQILSIIEECTFAEKDVRFIWSKGGKIVYSRLTDSIYNESNFPYSLMVYDSINTIIIETIKEPSQSDSSYDFEEVQEHKNN